MKNFFPLSRWRVIDGLILGGGFYLRFQTLARRDWSGDELEQLRALHDYSFKNLLGHYLPSIPGGFPGDYLLTWPLAQVTANKWVLVAPHIAATLVAFGLYLKIRRNEAGGELGTALGLAMMAFNRELIFHDFELRPYGLLPAVALGSYWAVDRMFRQRKVTFIDAVLWMLLVVSVCLIHAYGILILASLCLFHLLKAIPIPRPAQAQAWRIASLTMLALALALPLWLFFAKVPARHHDPFAFCRPSVTGVLSFFLGNLGDWGWHFSWIPGTLVITASCLLVQASRWRQHLLFIIILLICPLGVIFVSDVLSRYWFVQRQFTWAMPFWALAIARSIDLFKNRQLIDSPQEPVVMGQGKTGIFA